MAEVTWSMAKEACCAGFSHNTEHVKVLARNGVEQQLLRLSPNVLFTNKASAPKGFTTSQNSTTAWEPR